MAKDRQPAGFIVSNILVLAGKPLYFLILGVTIGAYFLALLVRRFLVQLNKLKAPKPVAIRKLKKPVAVLRSGQKIIKANFKAGFLKGYDQGSKLRNYLIARFRLKPVSYRLKLPKFRVPKFKIDLPKPKFKRPVLNFEPRVKLPRPGIRPVRFLVAAILVLSVAAGSGVAFYRAVMEDLPHPRDLVNRQQAVTTKIYDRNHQLLYKVYKNENRSIIQLDDLPDYVVKATLAIEDREFYQHPGFSVRGIARAFTRNLTEDRLQGGSTITQQLVKNALLTSERTFSRKIKELILSVMVENYFTKDEILTMYLNEVGYGGPAYGIEEAAQLYFAKPAKKLTVGEAALLAGLPGAPTTFSPFGVNPERAKQRQGEVLRRMAEDGHLTEEQVLAALNDPLEYARPTTDILAPHFVMYVRDILVERYGEELVNQGGLEVITTLDMRVQKLAEEAIRSELERLTKLNVSNAAVIVTDPNTGEILAMVGSKDYFDTENDGQVNVTLRPRQPGSSIKPVNYAMALSRGLTPATLIVDAPVTYQIAGSSPYSPQNYDGRYHGIVTLRAALANSYNIPAVKTLNRFGVEQMVEMGRMMGVTTWEDSSRFGLALTLGGGEVTLADMAVVYGTFANGGNRVALNPLVEVSDYLQVRKDDFRCSKQASQLAAAKEVQASEGCGGTPALSEAVAFLITDILADNTSRAPAFGLHSVLNIPGQQVAVKTGTTNSLRDNWTIGYTKDYVVAVWVGNNDNTPMSRVASGITGASPIWNQIMRVLLTNQEQSHRFEVPEGVVQRSICTTTGTLTCNGCPRTVNEFFIAGSEPQRACMPEFFAPTPEFPAEENRQNRPPGLIRQGRLD